MTVETFITNFAHLADAPNGVRKLRELILQLAVQGKLVPQDPEDEPASVLLERIEVTRNTLVKKGVMKKPKKVEHVSREFPAKLPNTWKSVQLGQITHIRTGKLDANASSSNGEFPFFTCAKDPLKIDRFAYDCECVLLAGNGNFDVNYTILENLKPTSEHI